MANYEPVSVSIDIHSLHGGSHIMLRQVQLLLDGEPINLLAADIDAFGPSITDQYLPMNAFNTATSLTGGQYYNQWGCYTHIKPRITMRAKTGKLPAFNGIRISNGHYYGGSTERGVREITITISNVGTNSTTYKGDIPEGVEIFTGEIPRHVASDTVDWYVVPLVQDVVITPLRSLVLQSIHASSPVRAMLLGSLKSVFAIRNGITQICQRANIIRAELAQDTSCTSQYRAELIQSTIALKMLREKLVQQLSLSGGGVRASLVQRGELRKLDRLRVRLSQLMSLSSGRAIIKRYNFKVLVENNGIESQFTSYKLISDETDLDQYYIAGELQLADVGEYLQCHFLKTRIAIIDGDERMEFICLRPRKVRGGGKTSYIVPLASPAVLLGHKDSGLSKVDEAMLAGGMDQIAEHLVHGIELHWDLPSPYTTLYVEGRNSIDCLRELVNAVGGVVQSRPDGSIHCHPEDIIDVDKYDGLIPHAIFTAEDDLKGITSAESPRDGYNAVLVSDKAIDNGGLSLATEVISGRRAKAKVFILPFDDNAIVNLLHSSGAWVFITKEGVVEEELSESVEFVAGEGRLGQQCYGITSVIWQDRDLGVVAAQEDGSLSATLPENSLATIRYTTKYHLFTVYSLKVGEVQVYPSITKKEQ